MGEGGREEGIGKKREYVHAFCLPNPCITRLTFSRRSLSVEGDKRESHGGRRTQDHRVSVSTIVH